MYNFNETEIVICLDGEGKTEREGNIVYCFSPPSKYRSTFHEKPMLEATGRFMMMANDDIEFVTKDWDRLIPYEDYPDDYVLFHFRDNYFNSRFACHPIFSRKLRDNFPSILAPLYQITKCDNTIWDVHPAARRIYLDNIELIHHHTDWGEPYKQAYLDDNVEYALHQEERIKIRNHICREIGMKIKILMVIPTGEMARKATFYDHFNMIQKPEGTVVMFVHGQSVAANRNQGIKAALEYGCTHIFFLDDDVIAKPDILFQLLKHQKEVVCALQLARNYPHRPYLFDKSIEGGKFRWWTLEGDASGLIPIKAAGLGAILIRTEVFTQLDLPYFRLGQISAEDLGEDLDFFNRINKLGIQSYCDLDCRVGHVATATIWPEQVKGAWYVTYDTEGPSTINFLHTEQKVPESVS